MQTSREMHHTSLRDEASENQKVTPTEEQERGDKENCGGMDTRYQGSLAIVSSLEGASSVARQDIKDRGREERDPVEDEIVRAPFSVLLRMEDSCCFTAEVGGPNVECDGQGRSWGFFSSNEPGLSGSSELVGTTT